ncbi:hypothetical protein HBB16_05590 [Pseudonocardia sp. MCCB 268]|nr:hypothetical protein [Pseudonocardia cytotoxica]
MKLLISTQLAFNVGFYMVLPLPGDAPRGGTSAGWRRPPSRLVLGAADVQPAGLVRRRRRPRRPVRCETRRAGRLPPRDQVHPAGRSRHAARGDQRNSAHQVRRGAVLASRRVVAGPRGGRAERRPGGPARTEIAPRCSPSPARSGR